MARIRVELGPRSYPLVISRQENRLARELVRVAGDNNVFVCFDANVYALHGARILRALKTGHRRVIPFVIPSGERAKTMATVQRLYDFLIGERISRSDLVLVVGGGVTTDIVGFAAATVLRGVSWAAVPTTLLGMVDAAIGGKTGINHPSGKNLIGAIWQPRFVLIDTMFLYTLPERELISGLGEVTKYAGLLGEPMLSRLERYLDRGDLLHEKDISWLITESVRCKAALVSADEREAGKRMALNLGHTFGHGIEHALGYGRLLHGEAVLLGLYAAMILGRMIGIERIPRQNARYRELLRGLLGLVPSRRLDSAAVLKAMRHDKKRRSTTLRFVLLAALGKPIFADSVKSTAVRAALREMLRAYEAS